MEVTTNNFECETETDDNGELCKLLELIVNHSETCDKRSWRDSTHSSHEHSGQPRIKESKANATIHQLFWLLRDCLLAHRWHEVMSVFTAIIAEPSDNLLTHWRVGCELIMLEKEDGVEIMQQFINNLKRKPNIDTQEVILQFVIYLIKYGRLDDAANALQNIPNKLKKSTKDADQRRLLLRAYQGLIHYIQWVNTKDKLEQLVQQTVVSSDDESHDNISDKISQTENVMMSQSRRAINCFSKLNNTPGTWDIFIDKHIKLLVYEKDLEEAEQVLLSNCDTNPTNPNSHRYLLDFYKTHHASSRSIITVLKRLVSLVPSDEAALELVTLLNDAEARIPILFNLLDYQCWQDNPQPWTLLLKDIKSLVSSERMPVIKQAWNSRQSWWPQFHFHGRQLCTDETRDLLNTKAAVADLLFASGHQSRTQELDSQPPILLPEPLFLKWEPPLLQP